MRLPISDQQQLWSYLAPFQIYCGLILLKTSNPFLFRATFGDVSLGLDRRYWAAKCEDSRLIIREITLEATEGQTDRRTTCDSNTVFCTTCIAGQK